MAGIWEHSRTNLLFGIELQITFVRVVVGGVPTLSSSTTPVLSVLSFTHLFISIHNNKRMQLSSTSSKT
ncbi:hypothetical protein VNO77_20461 [Canavalia gladiata]|uniref:Uncharacterized protein n=1 Tax=Canavalia gladiata TaxID=3824 RepID=A0AAN9LPI7_CANGL